MSAKSAARELAIGGEPRVQLLPPFVRLKAKNAQTRRMLVLLVILAVAIVGGGLTYGTYRSLEATAALTVAQNETTTLIQQQAQYAEAGQLAGLVSATQETQKLMTKGEVDWKEVVDHLATYLPAGAVFQGLAATAPAPWEPALVPEGPLRAERVATLTLTIASVVYNAAAAFVAAVQDDEAVADVLIVSSTLDGVQYLTQVSLTLNETVLHTRFDDSDDPEEEGESTDGDSTTDDSATTDDSTSDAASDDPAVATSEGSAG